MKRLFMLTLTVLAVTIFAYGQSTSSGVTGIVTDKNGAVIPGVTVVLLDTKTSVEQTTTTNENGVYKFANIQPGSGFKLPLPVRGSKHMSSMRFSCQFRGSKRKMLN